LISANLHTKTDAGVTARAKVDPVEADLAPRPVSDEQLMGRISGGEASALGELYDRYIHWCFSLVHRMLGNPSKAEEAVREVLVALWVRPDRYPVSYSVLEAWFLSWLLNVTHNKCTAELRLLRLRHPEVAPDIGKASIREELLDIMIDAALGAADQKFWREQRLRLQQVLERLAIDRRQVVELAYFEGLSQAEIATKLAQPLDTINAHTKVALQELQALCGWSR
jgi:RNA polymerase sigma-70 factor, ECF subfamily